MANPVAANLKATKVAVKQSMDYHNANLIGKEGTPEYQTWLADHLALSKDMGLAMKAAKETVKVAGPPDWTPGAEHWQGGLVDMPSGLENAPNEVQAQFFYRLEKTLRDDGVEEMDDLLIKRPQAVEAMGG